MFICLQGTKGAVPCAFGAAPGFIGAGQIGTGRIGWAAFCFTAVGADAKAKILAGTFAVDAL